ncbi:MAG: hypothetical protein HZB09_00425 [Candidatus Yonathbacteria bacterium]|nr:hypothetical protein [Candidatus Yonathbacteria bacterium]
MHKHNKKLVDGILKRAQISDAEELRFVTQTSLARPTALAYTRSASHISYGFSKRHADVRRVSFGKFGRFLLVSKLSLLFVLVMSVVPMTAFEAHVVNVTATIERKSCVTYEVKSMGFWKTHDNLWIFPQTLGSDTIATSTDAAAVFNADNSSMRNKLKKQLLALKFNDSYYGLGNALVPNSTTTITTLIAQADALLSLDPPPVDSVLEAMKNQVESVNTAQKVSTCPPPPPPPGGTCSNDDQSPKPPHDISDEGDEGHGSYNDSNDSPDNHLNEDKKDRGDNNRDEENSDNNDDTSNIHTETSATTTENHFPTQNNTEIEHFTSRASLAHEGTSTPPTVIETASQNDTPPPPPPQETSSESPSENTSAVSVDNTSNNPTETPPAQ